MRELKRKAFHVCGLLYIPFLRALGARATPALGGLVALIGLAEIARLKAPAARSSFERFFGGLLREKERRRLSGLFYAALGIFASSVLYGAYPPIRTAGIVALFLGDSVSPIVGLCLPVGLYKVMGVVRSWPGSLAAALTVFAGSVFLGFAPLAALTAAAAFSLVDIFPVAPDDNLWIPVVVSTALFLTARP